ncbi:MAG: imidazole glycerol phosphate synthase subunit HisH [Flavobacteriaceae bacterium]
MIAIVDYGMGNLASVQKALKQLGLDSLITNDHRSIEEASSILLPGVGSFHQGMKNLENLGLPELLKQQVLIHKKPFLGICLGMQLIMENGTEPEICSGLGWIKGWVKPIENKKLPIPHLGWNRVYDPKINDQKDTIENNFYFIHSYHVVPEEDVKLTYVNYEYPLVASIEKGHIFATQFHPEKSQESGLELMKAFYQKYA